MVLELHTHSSCVVSCEIVIESLEVLIPDGILANRASGLVLGKLMKIGVKLVFTLLNSVP